MRPDRPARYLANLTPIVLVAAATAADTRTVQPLGGDAIGSDVRPDEVAHAHSLADCAPEQWFDMTPRRFAGSCGNAAPLSVGALPLTPADVNADGTPEVLSLVNPGEPPLVAQGEPLQGVPADLVRVSRVTPSATGPVAASAIVCAATAALGDALAADLPAAPGLVNCSGYEWRIRCAAKGWSDCDGDGDLDLVITVKVLKYACTFKQPMSPYAREFDHSSEDLWLENIGFEVNKSQIAADLNGDGQVDGADLTIVLASWGPTP